MAVDEFVFNGFGSAGGGGGLPIQGTQGVQGIQGLQGIQGVDGLISGQGIQGVQGVQGLQSTQGIQAIRGIQGNAGTEGIGTTSLPFGGFYDNDDQPLLSITSSQVVEITQQWQVSNISISSNRIILAQAGTYAITFTTQLSSLSNDDEFAKFWIAINGNNIGDSCVESYILKANGGTPTTQQVTLSYIFQTGNPNDYLEIYWSGTSTDLLLVHEPSQTTPIQLPETPSVKVAILGVDTTENGVQGVQGIQGIQSTQGIQGGLSSIQSSWGYYYRTTNLIPSVQNTYVQSYPWDGVQGSFWSAQYSPQISGNASAQSLGFARFGSNTNVVGYKWRQYYLVRNSSVNDIVMEIANAWYITFERSQTITIKAGQTKAISIEFIRQNTNTDYVYNITNYFLVTLNSGIDILEIRTIENRVVGAPIAGERGIQGIQGVLGFQSTTPTRFVQVGMLTKSTASTFLSITFDAIISQSGGFSIGTLLLSGVSTNTNLLFEGYVLIKNTGSATDTFTFAPVSQAIVGVAVQVFTIRIPNDGNAYPLYFSCIKEPSANNAVISCYVASTSQPFEVVGNPTYGFRMTISELTGVQGTQGTQGRQAVQGTQGIAIQGIQGLQGEIGLIGLQGTESSIQGITGITASNTFRGLQGTQGLQGFSNYATDAPIYFYAYNTTSQTLSVGSTTLTFNTTSGSPYFTSSSSDITCIKNGWYKVSVIVTIENASASTANVQLWLDINNTAQAGTTNFIEVAPSQYDTIFLEEIVYISQPNSTLRFRIETNVAVNSFAFGASSNYPSSGANKIFVELISRFNEIATSAKLSWTTGYFNLTNGIDNQIPFNLGQRDGFEGYLRFNSTGTSNANIEILSTGVYTIDTFAHFYDLGSSITMSITLYSSTNGTTWSFLTITALQRYDGTNTNQIEEGRYLLRVTSLPFYIQMRVNPSGNSPFPADLGAPTNFQVTRIGDI